MIETWFSDDMTERQIGEIAGFCEKAAGDFSKPAHINMVFNAEDPRTLAYLLFQEKLFQKGKGGLCIKRDEFTSEIVGLSGFYRSAVSPFVFAMGVRTWVLKEKRQGFTMSRHLFPHMFELAKEFGAKLGYWSFNSYNRRYFEAFSQTQSHPRYQNSDRIFSFYKDMVFLPYPVRIRNVEQWVCYKKTDPAFEFDWSSIKVSKDENVQTA
jgi:hypothetical protein